MMERIAGAGIEAPKETSNTQWEARRCFIEKLNGISPDGPVDSLRDAVFPRYRDARLAGNLIPSSWVWPAHGSTDPMPEEIRELLQAIEAWAIKFRLAQGFIYAALFSSLDKWYESPEAGRILEYRETLPMLCRATVAEVRTAMEWLPGHDSKSAARANYLEQAARDFDRSAAKWEGAGVRFDLELIALFVSSQIHGESASSIAKVNPRTNEIEIRRKLQKAARLLGWHGPRFRAAPGRKPDA